MVPKLNVAPEATSEVKVLKVQLSAPVGATQVTAAVHTSTSVFWVMSAGMPEMVGASLSSTVTSKLLEVVLPLMSVDV